MALKYMVDSQGSENILKHMLGETPIGGYSPGTRIEKTSGEKDDIHPIGTQGTVKGGISYRGITAYIVDFNCLPGALTFVLKRKIKEVKE